MSLRPLPIMLALALCGILGFAGEAERVRVSDDFATDTLRAYKVEGEVTWQKGQVRLDKDARLTRQVGLGYTAEVRAVLRPPAGKEAWEATLQFHALDASPAVALARLDGRWILRNLAKFPEDVPLGAGPQGKPPTEPLSWQVRFELHYGVAQAKAWPLGTAEPKEWLTARYTGEAASEPHTVSIAAGGSGGGRLESLAIAGTVPFKLPPDRERKAEQVSIQAQQLAPLIERGNHPEAVPKARALLALAQEVFGPEHIATVTMLDRLGGLLQSRADYAGGRSYHEQALAIRQNLLGLEHPHTAESLIHLGDVHTAMGEYPAARRRYQEGLAIQRKLLGSDHPDTAECLNSLGRVLHAMGEYSAARSALEQALAVRRKAMSKDHPKIAVSLSNLGALLQVMGEHAAARDHYEQALVIVERALGKEHFFAAAILNNLGMLRERSGELDAARDHYERSLAIRRKTVGEKHPEMASVLNNLGMLHQDAGNHRAARRHFEQALAVCREALGDEHPDTATSLHNLGTLLQAMGETPAAWQHLADGAAIYTRQASGLLAASAEREHGSILARWRFAFDKLLSLAEEAPGLADGRASELLTGVLDWKAPSARALLARQEALLSGDAPTRGQYEQLREVRQRLSQFLQRGPAQAPPAGYRQAVSELREQQETLERELARRVEGFGALRQSQRAGPNDLVRRLAPGSVLVEFIRYDQHLFRARKRDQRWGPARYAALLLWQPAKLEDPAVVRWLPLGEAGPIEQAVQTWRIEAERGPIDPATERRLRERVWEPLARVLPHGTDRLLLAPDGQLALLPFEAVRLDDQRYLIEKFQVSYVSSGRDLMSWPVPPGQPGPALILADPDYDALDDTARPAVPSAVAAVGQLRSGELAEQGMRFQRLPGFASEAKAVAEALQAAQPRRPVRLLQGRDAPEEALSRAARPWLLYLVTHGFLLSDQPRQPGNRRDFELVPLASGAARLPRNREDPRLRSGVALTGANQWQKRAARGQSDGLLTALEVQNLDLWGTELVVLSACETGLGKVQVGEGVLGLRRAFQLAGAQTVVASLWKVPDQETERLMTRFLKLWLASRPKAQALREAQLEMLADLRRAADPKRRSAPPLLWSGFICHGRPE